MQNNSPSPLLSSQGRGKEIDLLIDTIQKGQIVFQILNEDESGRLKPSTTFKKYTETLSEEILSQLGKFLKENKVKLKDLQKILVNPGPGGFSSTRTGVAVANALSLALGIPVAEWPSGKIKEIVMPKYDKAPNITKPGK